MKLANKVAIVTGGSRGIGKAICLGFADEGADIAVAARSEVEDQSLPGTIYQTAKEIECLGRRALAIRCNITREEEVERMVKSTLEGLGRIDILVNNAAVAHFKPFVETPTDLLEQVVKLNIIGMLICTKCVLPHMIKQGGGSIINISSRVAQRSGRGGAVYAATKAAVDRFTWGLAEEVGKYNIAVNALKPRGPVLTDSNKLANPDADFSQWDPPEAMVKAAVFLAAQDAGGVTGVAALEDQIRAWHGLT